MGSVKVWFLFFRGRSDITGSMRSWQPRRQKGSGALSPHCFVTPPTATQHTLTFSSPHMFPCVPFPTWRLTGNQSAVIRWTCCQLQSSLWLSTEEQPGTRLHNHAHSSVRARWNGLKLQNHEHYASEPLIDMHMQYRSQIQKWLAISFWKDPFISSLSASICLTRLTFANVPLMLGGCKDSLMIPASRRAPEEISINIYGARAPSICCHRAQSY